MKNIDIYFLMAFILTAACLFGMEEEKTSLIAEEAKNCSEFKEKVEKNLESNELDDITWDGLNESVKEFIVTYLENNRILPDATEREQINDILKKHLDTIIEHVIKEYRSDALKIAGIAAQNGCIKTFILMLSRGLELFSSDFLIFAPASQNRHDAFCKMLTEHGFFKGATNPELICAIFIHDQNKVEYLIQENRCESYLDDGSNEIMVAIAARDINILKLFLAIEGSRAVNHANRIGETPLMIASWSGFEEIVNLLLENGADVNAKDVKGKTALMDACRNGHKGVIKSLLKATNIEIDAGDNDDKTALMEAIYKNHSKIVRLLLKKGAKFDVKDINTYINPKSANVTNQDMIELLQHKIESSEI